MKRTNGYMAQADMEQKTFLTFGATSTTECELNVQKPITKLDGIDTPEDITSTSIN